MERKIDVFLEHLQQNVPLSPELTLLEGLLQACIPIDHSCGGFGTCGTCKVVVNKDSVFLLPERDFLEQEMATERGLSKLERLACQIYPCQGLRFHITKKGLE